MTNKIIYDNLGRLFTFYNYKDEKVLNSYNNENECIIQDLIDVYSRYLDFFGAYKIGVSLLFIENEDYDFLSNATNQLNINKRGFTWEIKSLNPSTLTNKILLK